MDPNDRSGGVAFSLVEPAIDGSNTAGDAASSMPLANVVFITVTALLPDVRHPKLTYSQDSMANDTDFVESLNDLNKSVRTSNVS